MSMSVSSTGMAVMQKSLQAFDKAAAMAAGQGSFADRAGKMTEALVAMQQTQVQVEVAAKSLSSEDKALGSLIDISV